MVSSGAHQRNSTPFVRSVPYQEKETGQVCKHDHVNLPALDTRKSGLQRHSQRGHRQSPGVAFVCAPGGRLVNPVCCTHLEKAPARVSFRYGPACKLSSYLLAVCLGQLDDYHPLDVGRRFARYVASSSVAVVVY